LTVALQVGAATEGTKGLDSSPSLGEVLALWQRWNADLLWDRVWATILKGRVTWQRPLHYFSEVMGETGQHLGNRWRNSRATRVFMVVFVVKV